MPTLDLTLLWLLGMQLDGSIQKTEGLLQAAVAKQAELRAKLDASKTGRQDSVRLASSGRLCDSCSLLLSAMSAFSVINAPVEMLLD